VFLALFYMLQDDLRRDICPDVNPASVVDPRPCGEGGDAAFLFIPDLTNNATGGVLVTLIVLYVGSQLLSTLLMSTTTDKTQRMIFLALPFLFIAFIWNFPAGLLVYWITTNVWTIVQQAIIRRRLGPIRPPGEESPSLGSLFAQARGETQTPTTTKPSKPSARPAAVAAGSAGSSGPEPRVPSGPPPSPPRRKKKRSGRRR
jgi:YidC/Oxa1 family membrane protein insertase